MTGPVIFVLLIRMFSATPQSWHLATLHPPLLTYLPLVNTESDSTHWQQGSFPSFHPPPLPFPYGSTGTPEEERGGGLWGLQQIRSWTDFWNKSHISTWQIRKEEAEDEVSPDPVLLCQAPPGYQWGGCGYSQTGSGQRDCHPRLPGRPCERWRIRSKVLRVMQQKTMSRQPDNNR